MTDADVDGSHIRTLLLTFFFPADAGAGGTGSLVTSPSPALQGEKRSQERYVKDDEELNAYFLQMALEGAELHVNQEAPSVEDAALEELASDFRALLGRLGKMYRVLPTVITEALIDLPALTLDALHDEAGMRAWSERLQTRLASEKAVVSIVLDPGASDLVPAG